MKKGPLYLILIFILLMMLLSGCLPKVPEKITGPTWTSKYRIPLFKIAGDNKIYFNYESPENEDAGNFGLEDVKTDFSYHYKAEEPVTFELIEEQPTINFDPIPDISVEFSSSGVAVEVVVDKDSPKLTYFAFEDVDDYVNLTLTDNKNSVNSIEINLNGATATGDGFFFVLMDGTSIVDEAEIKDGESTGSLDLSGLKFSPKNELSIMAYGNLKTIEDTNEIGITFTPAPLEIKSFTITKDLFKQEYIDENEIEAVEETIELEDMADIELSLKSAILGITSNLPDNLAILAELTLIAYDENEEELDYFTRSITLSSQNQNTLELIGDEPNLNTILKSKPYSLTLILDFAIEVLDDVTISYPDNSIVSLDYWLDIKFGSFTVGSEEDQIEIGEIEIPDDFPLDFAGGEIFVEVNNNSAADLQIDFWISPTRYSFTDKNKFTVFIKPNEAIVSKNPITTDHYDLFRNHDLLYYKFKITNDPLDEAVKENFDEDDYLEISAWADLNVKVNPR